MVATSASLSRIRGPTRLQGPAERRASPSARCTGKFSWKYFLKRRERRWALAKSKLRGHFAKPPCCASRCQTPLLETAGVRARTQYAARSLTGHSCNEGRTRRLCHIPQQNGPQEIERKALKIMLCSGAAARRGSISQWSRGPSTLSRRCARTLHVCPKNQDPTRFP